MITSAGFTFPLLVEGGRSRLSSFLDAIAIALTLDDDYSFGRRNHYL